MSRFASGQSNSSALAAAACFPGRRRATALLLLAACCLPLQLASATVLFNPGDLGQFTLNAGHASNLSITAGAGVGGGSGLTSTAASFSDDSAIFSTGAALVAGRTYNVSMFYRMNLQSSGPDVRLGFNTNLAGDFDFNAPPHVWFETFGGSTPKSSFAGGTGISQSGSTVSMVNGNWYRMALNLTTPDLINFALTASIDDFGTAGTSLVGNVSNQTFSFADTALGGASTLFGGFYAHGATTAFDNFNFSAASVPEPATLAIMGLAVSGLAFQRRRRRRA